MVQGEDTGPTPAKEAAAAKGQSKRRRVTTPDGTGRRLCCEHCSDSFKKQKNLTDHVERYHTEDGTQLAYLCPLCEQLYSRSDGVYDHLGCKSTTGHQLTDKARDRHKRGELVRVKCPYLIMDIRDLPTRMRDFRSWRQGSPSGPPDYDSSPESGSNRYARPG